MGNEQDKDYKTSVQMNRSTVDRMKSMASKDESYDDFINRILDERVGEEE